MVEGIGDIATKVVDKVTQGVNSILGKIENWYNSQKAGDDLAWAEVELLLKPYARELLDLVQDKRDMQMLMFLLTRNQINKGFIRNLFDKIKRKGLRAVYKMEKEFGGFATEGLDEEELAELKVQQQKPKIEVLNNIAARKDGTAFPLSWNSGKDEISVGGKLYVDPKTANRFVTFFDNNKDKQDAIVQALRSATTTAKLFDVLGLEYNLRMDK